MTDPIIYERVINEQCADRIRDYWREKGYPRPQLLIIEIRTPAGNFMGCYGVRSNMIGGWPPKERAAP